MKSLIPLSRVELRERLYTQGGMRDCFYIRGKVEPRGTNTLSVKALWLSQDMRCVLVATQDGESLVPLENASRVEVLGSALAVIKGDAEQVGEDMPAPKKRGRPRKNPESASAANPA